MARIRLVRALACIAFLLSLPLLAPVSAQELLRATRTISSSGQFVLYSNDATRRTKLARRAEEAKSEWTRRLGNSEGKSYPIIIRDLLGSTRPRGSAPIVTVLYEGDGGTPKVQVDVYDTTALRGRLFEIEIFRALGLERIYRNIPVKAGKSIHSPPSWIIEGIAEDLRVREEGVPPGVYAALLRSEHPPRLEDFLKTKTELLEATSLSLYRTQAMALLHVLMQLPEGKLGLSSLLESAAHDDANIKSVLAAYPSLENNSSRLIKMWTLSMARDSTTNRLDPLSIAETERALTAILDLSANANPRKQGAKTVQGTAALPLVARGEGGPFIMRQKSTELLNLEFRCHPLLKPVVEEYRNIAMLLANKPKKDVAKRIEENDKIRVLLQKRSQLLNDYMNWFEATQLNTLSENFLMISNPPQAPKRTDPITRYLDAIEERGW